MLDQADTDDELWKTLLLLIGDIMGKPGFDSWSKGVTGGLWGAGWTCEPQKLQSEAHLKSTPYIVY